MNSVRSIAVDITRKYQQIDHFGASGAWSLDPIGQEWSEKNKNTIADWLFSTEKGIGLSAWRFNVGGGSAVTDKEIIADRNRWRRSETFKLSEDADYDWDRQAGQQWFLRAAKARGVDQFIAFVNSPPGWMTKNGHAQADSRVGTTNLKEGYEGVFAQYIADILSYFKDEAGIPFTCVSPINEPSWAWDESQQEGNRYSNADIKKVIDAVYEQLQKRDLDVEVDAPEAAEIFYLLDDGFYQRFVNDEHGYYVGHDNATKHGGKYREFIKEFLGDVALRRKIGGKVCGHSYFMDYRTDTEDRLAYPRRLLRENIDLYAPGAKYWQTEYCVLGSKGLGRDVGIDTALEVANVIHYDLTMANASAWNWWLAVSPYDYKDGLIYTDYSTTDDAQNIIATKTLWALGHYSKFIRPGFYRIDVTGFAEEDDEGVLVSGYVNEATREICLVLINNGAEDASVRIVSETDGKFLDCIAAYVTNGDRGVDLSRYDAVSAVYPGFYTIPKRAIVTLTGKYTGIE